MCLFVILIWPYDIEEFVRVCVHSIPTSTMFVPIYPMNSFPVCTHYISTIHFVLLTSSQLPPTIACLKDLHMSIVRPCKVFHHVETMFLCHRQSLCYFLVVCYELRHFYTHTTFIPVGLRTYSAFECVDDQQLHVTFVVPIQMSNQLGQDKALNVLRSIIAKCHRKRHNVSCIVFLEAI